MPSAIATSPRYKFFDDNGNPAAYYLLYTYAAGTLTPQTTWADQGQAAANPNPIILDASGECLIWVENGKEYKFVLKTPGGAIISTTDNISGNSTSVIDGISAPSGSSLVGFIQAGSGAVSETAQDKLREVVSVRDFGAKADGSYDCYSSVVSAANAVGSGGVLRFPNSVDDTGVYYFGANFPTDELSGISIDADPGVVLSIPNNNYVVGTVAGASDLVFKNATKFKFRAENREYVVSPKYHAPFSEKSIWLDSPSFDVSKLYSINSTDFVPKKVLWDTGDTFLADSYSASDSSSFTADSSVDGYVHAALRRCYPGDEIICSAQPTLEPLAFIVVRHSGGYIGVYGSTNATQSDLKFFSKQIGGAMTVSTIGLGIAAGHAAYYIKNGMISARIDAWNRVMFRINGLDIYDAQTSGTITEVGFGSMQTAIGQAMKFGHLVVTNNSEKRGARSISLAVFGDSKSCDRYDSWPAYMREALDLSAGVRVKEALNSAIAGTSSNEIKTAVQSANLAPYDFVIVSGGTNDIQGGMSLSGSMANFTSIVSTIQSAGKSCILILPSVWYTQTQSGGGGQASLYYENAGLLRSGLIRLAADTGCRVVNPLNYEGPVTANWINPALNPNLVGKGDPVIFDNIHPTTLSNRLTGREVARAVLGLLNPYINKNSLYQSVSITPQNNWGITTEPPYVNVSSAGEVYLTGVLNTTGAEVKTDGTIIGVVQPSLCPVRAVRCVCFSDVGMIKLYLDTSGNIRIYGFTTGTYVDLSGLRWNLPV